MAFATLADFDIYMRKVHVGDDAASALQALDMASGLIRAYTKQTIDRVVGDVVTLSVRSYGLVILPQLPVVSVASVEQNGVPLTEWTLHPHGMLVLNGWSWRPVTVTYTHGYDPIPYDVQTVCLRLAGEISKTQQGPAGGGAVIGETIGNYSYRVDSSFTVATASMGGLNDLDRRTLDTYRVGA